MSILKSLLAATAVAYASVVNAYTTLPQDGLWGIDAELSLAVGRAFVLETAGSVTGVTFYNYNTVGAPTFYVGGGLLSSGNTLSAILSEPRGGTCLGCAPTSGSLLSSPGTAFFEFTSSTTGFVTLPKEGRKAIRKGDLGFGVGPTGLLGGWAFTYLTTATSSTAFADYAALVTTIAGTSTGTGIAVNAAGTIGCEQQVTGSLAGYVSCVSTTQGGNLDKRMLTKWFGHHMDGIWQYTALGVSSSFTARRFVSDTNQYDIKRAAETVPMEAAQALRAALERVIAETPRPE